MKIKIIVLLSFLILLVGCSQPDLLKITKDWEKIGFNKGMNKGIEICENNYRPILEQFIPPDNCTILIIDKYSMKYICEGDKQ